MSNETVGVHNSPYKIAILAFSVSNTVGILFVLLIAALSLFRRRAKVNSLKVDNLPTSKNSQRTRADIKNGI